ncbi:MAG: hypothetical protein NTW76_01635 [Corynebacteriales bacterium]|nr:hypothetical protein [Mycobacteriales bacterium]
MAHAVDARRRGAGGSAAVWAAVAAAAGVGFVIAPSFVVGDPYGAGITGGRRLAVAATGAVDGFLGRHAATVSGPLADLTDYWSQYHWVKVVFAIAAVVALVALGRRLVATAAPTSTRVARVWWAVVGGALSLAVVAASVLAVANVQGALAPLSSALSLLPDESTRAAAGGVMSRGATDPAVATLISDFGRYHAVLAVSLGVVVAAFAAVAVVATGRARRADRGGRRRPMVGASAVVFAVATLALGVVVAANIGTAVDPEPALRLFFTG